MVDGDGYLHLSFDHHGHKLNYCRSIAPDKMCIRDRSLTAAVVVVVGLFGAVFGFKVLRVGHVGSPSAQGLSMGTATHAVGTSTAMEISGKYGAYASLGLTLKDVYKRQSLWGGK